MSKKIEVWEIVSTNWSNALVVEKLAEVEDLMARDDSEEFILRRTKMTRAALRALPEWDG